MDNLETLKDELMAIDMVLQYATKEERTSLKKMRRSVLNSIRLLDEKDWGDGGEEWFIEEDY